MTKIQTFDKQFTAKIVLQTAETIDNWGTWETLFLCMSTMGLKKDVVVLTLKKNTQNTHC